MLMYNRKKRIELVCFISFFKGGVSTMSSPEEKAHEESMQTIRDGERDIHTLIESEKLPAEKGTSDVTMEERSRRSSLRLLEHWRDFDVETELPSLGGEADLYIVKRESSRFVLKLYRRGMEPKEHVLSLSKKLSDEVPQHVVKIFEYGYDKNSGRWFELQEYLPLGNLRDFVSSKKPSNFTVKLIINELNEALRVLHEKGLIHRDLKPSNILVRSEDPLNLVLADFGVSSILDERVSRKLTTVKGTPVYSAPETFSGIVGREVDYWALGIIVYELIVGHTPFEGLSLQTIIYKLTTTDIDLSGAPEGFRPLLEGLLRREPKKRWGYEEVRKWLDGDFDMLSRPKSPAISLDDSLAFAKKRFQSVEELTLDFLRDGLTFRLAEQAIQDGTLRSLLVSKELHKRVVVLTECVEKSSSPAEAVVRFAYQDHRDLPLVLYGIKIDEEYVKKLFVSGIGSELSTADDRIFQLLSNRLFSKILDAYEETTANKLPESLKTLVLNIESAFKINRQKELAVVLSLVEQFPQGFLPAQLNVVCADFDVGLVTTPSFVEILSSLRVDENGTIFYRNVPLLPEKLVSRIASEVGKIGPGTTLTPELSSLKSLLRTIHSDFFQTLMRLLSPDLVLPIVEVSKTLETCLEYFERFEGLDLEFFASVEPSCKPCVLVYTDSEFGLWILSKLKSSKLLRIVDAQNSEAQTVETFNHSSDATDFMLHDLRVFLYSGRRVSFDGNEDVLFLTGDPLLASRCGSFFVPFDFSDREAVADLATLLEKFFFFRALERFVERTDELLSFALSELERKRNSVNQNLSAKVAHTFESIPNTLLDETTISRLNSYEQASNLCTELSKTVSAQLFEWFEKVENSIDFRSKRFMDVWLSKARSVIEQRRQEELRALESEIAKLLSETLKPNDLIDIVNGTTARRRVRKSLTLSLLTGLLFLIGSLIFQSAVSSFLLSLGALLIAITVLFSSKRVFSKLVLQEHHKLIPSLATLLKKRTSYVVEQALNRVKDAANGYFVAKERYLRTLVDFFKDVRQKLK